MIIRPSGRHVGGYGKGDVIVWANGTASLALEPHAIVEDAHGHHHLIAVRHMHEDFDLHATQLTLADIGHAR